MQKDTSTEEKILLAATAIFLNKGLESARMQDIADEAGINKALLHYYFRNKETLFEKIFANVIEELMPRVFEILNSDRSLFEKIHLFCEAYIRQFMATPYVPMFILKEMNRDPDGFVKRVLKGRRPPLDVITSQIAHEINARHIRPVHPLSLLLNILSLCVFPFLARPILESVLNVNTNEFRMLMENRIYEVPEMIIQSIQMNNR